jgi:hypothetical protein
MSAYAIVWPPAMPDTLGYRKNFGIVIPSVNTAAQPEFEAMRPHGVTNQTARIFIPHIPLVDDASFVRHVETMRSGITVAVEQIATCQPDHLVMGLSRSWPRYAPLVKSGASASSRPIRPSATPGCAPTSPRRATRW